MSQLLQKNKPIVTNTLVITAFSIHILLNIADFGFYSWEDNIHSHKDHFTRFLVGMFKPIVSAAFLAPFICLVRNTTVIGEFKNMLMFALTISIIFSILNFSGASNIRY